MDINDTLIIDNLVGFLTLNYVECAPCNNFFASLKQNVLDLSVQVFFSCYIAHLLYTCFLPREVCHDLFPSK